MKFAPGQGSDAMRRFLAVAPGKVEQLQHRAHTEVFNENHIQHAVVISGIGSEKKVAAIAAHIGKNGKTPGEFIEAVIDPDSQSWRAVKTELLQTGNMIGIAAEQFFKRRRNGTGNHSVKTDAGHKNEFAAVAGAEIAFLRRAGQQQFAGFTHLHRNPEFASNDVGGSGRYDAGYRFWHDTVDNGMDRAVTTAGRHQTGWVGREALRGLAGISDTGGKNCFTRQKAVDMPGGRRKFGAIESARQRWREWRFFQFS